MAVIDAEGRSAAYTGRYVVNRNYDPDDRVHFGGSAGHTEDVNFSAQGNTLASEEVALRWPVRTRTATAKKWQSA